MKTEPEFTPRGPVVRHHRTQLRPVPLNTLCVTMR